MRGAVGRRGSSWAHVGASQILQKALAAPGGFCTVLLAKVQVAGCWVFSLCSGAPVTLAEAPPELPESPGGGENGLNGVKGRGRRPSVPQTLKKEVED